MAPELNPVEHENQKPGETRRSFLVKLGIGAAALGLVAGSLSSLRGIGGGNSGTSTNTEFPDEDSISTPQSIQGRTRGARTTSSRGNDIVTFRWPCLLGGHCCMETKQEDDKCLKQD